MNKIIVYRTRIEINNYELGDCRTLERCFSIYDKVYHREFLKGIVYDAENKLLKIPRGIDISWLENLFCSNAVVDQTCDPSVDIGYVKLRFLPRDDVQKEALRFMLSDGKYYRNKDRTMLSVNLNTGKGKTYCAIATMSFIRARSIIITYNKEWLDQWKKFICEYTNIKEDEVYFISGSASIHRLYNRDISKYKVFLSTHATLKSYGDSYGWNSITDLFQYLSIGLKFYDEAHLNFDNMCYIDFYTNTFLTYYITATPGRSDLDENTIFNYYFKNVPSIMLFDQEHDPHTQYIALKFNSHPTITDVNQCKNKYGLDRNKYTMYLAYNQNFYYMLHILIAMVKRKPGKHLFYVGTNEAILHIKQWIYDNYPEFVGQVGIYTSIIKDNKKEELEKKIILSTTKSAGAAMDIKDLVETVVLDEPFKSKVLAQQTFGRTRAQNTIYKDIVDTGFHATKKFYDYKKPIFSKYATKCSEVNLSDKELKERAMKEFTKHQSMIQPITFFEK